MERKRRMHMLAAAAAGMLALFLWMQSSRNQAAFISYSDFWLLAESEQVEQVTLGDGENWQAVLKDGTRIITPNPRAVDGKERLLALDISVQEQTAAVPGLLIGLALVLALAYVYRGKGAAGLQKYAAVNAKEETGEITFQDVAVSEETLQSMRDLVDFLRAPRQFSAYGARAPKGVMLYGPPGTGKTLLARALAGEAKAPFFAMSGADFVQVYVGVGASRIRELFKKARKAGGGVIFIDEIDAIGKRRDGGNEEREQTLNALLTEMSGFSGADGIIVVAATNRLDTLDAALLREGRFDRRIEVGLPDQEQRFRILQVHGKNKPLNRDVSLGKWAAQTALFSGAQLEALLNEAAIRAARRGEGDITDEDMEKAFCAVLAGEERPRHMSEEEKRITAWHEAGHALVTSKMLPENRITRVTIIPSSRGAAGYSMSIQPEKNLYTRKELLGMICAALGGRAAEEILLGSDNVTTGAQNDLKKAREIAAAMADEFDMGETEEGTKDAKAIFNEAMQMTRTCLRDNRKTLEETADALLLRETLKEKELKEMIG